MVRWLARVDLPGCVEGEFLALRLVRALDARRDASDCVLDGVWRIDKSGTRERQVRLLRGRASIDELLDKYTLLDGDECSFNASPDEYLRRNAEYNARQTGEALGGEIDVAPHRMRRAGGPAFVYSEAALPLGALPCERALDDVGIPQRTIDSGICWWGSLWFAVMYPPPVRAVFLAGCAADPTLRALCERVLRAPDSSEPLRRHVYDTYAIGDDPAQAPHLDGQNGFGQFSLLCSALQIPLVTLMAPWMEAVRMALPNARKEQVPPPPRADPTRPALLGVRTYRSHWRPPHALEHGGRRWLLQSAWVGSEYCGHQCALARVDACEPGVEQWALYDSDGVRLGIGPITWHTTAAEWWDELPRVMPFTNKSASSKFCDMCPHNRHPMELVQRLLKVPAMERAAERMRSDAFRQVNVDWLYTSDPASSP